MDNWKLMYIGDTLKNLRKSRLLSQEDLAWDSKLNTRSISLLENNQQEPSLSTLSSLAAALGMDPSELIKEIEMDVHNKGWNRRKKSSKRKARMEK